jgi:NTE family protein
MSKHGFYHHVAAILIFLSAVPGWTVAAQSPEPLARPRIGLVLEGGGALGFAHIGVLQWLEEHHIPVDDVAGTSMGGLVGGLYASGESPAEIKKFVGGIDWSGVLSGQLPFDDLSYRRKEDRLAFPNRLEFGLKHGFTLPNGLNSGSAVGQLLDASVLPYYNLKSFDDLPIPFRCVSTNIVTGKKHVFSDGSLAQAMRSTMSIPGVFAPVQHGEDIYSDGFAVDNLPVDVARQMGSQIVIAVYLDTGTVDPSTFTSLVGVAGRNLSIMTAENEAPNIADANILVKADLSKYTSSDFTKSAEIIPKGYAAAQSHAAELEKYALNDADWKAYVEKRDGRRRTHLPEPSFVDVAGVKGNSQAEVAAKFQKFVNKPIDPKKIDSTIAGLEGTGLYASISYNMVQKGDETGLLLRPRLKNYGPPFLNLGITLSSNNVNDIQFGIGGRATFFDLAGPGSEVRVTGNVGAVAGASGELYKPLTARSNWFVSPRAYYVHTVTAYYSNNSALAEYTEHRNGVGGDLGYSFSSKAELRVGEDYQWYGNTLRVGDPIAQAFSLTPFISNINFEYLGQNSALVPTKGTEVSSLYTYYTQRPNGSGGFSKWNSSISTFIALNDKNSIFVTGAGGTSFGATNLGLAGFALGGPLRLSAYNRGQLLGSDYFLAQTGYLYRLARLNPVFGGDVYATGFYEIGKVWNAEPGTPSLPNDVALGAIMKTALGPVYGGISIGDSGHFKWYFGLGRVF